MTRHFSHPFNRFHEAYFSEMENGSGKVDNVDQPPSCANNGDAGITNKVSRDDKMERMKEESRDWFSKVREENNKWRRGYSTSAFADPEDRMQKFFEEAQKKFSSGNQEIFSRFMQDNKERFADILDDQNRIFFQTDLTCGEPRYQGPKRPNSLASEFSSGTSYSEDSRLNEKNFTNGGGGGRSTPKFPKRSPMSPDYSPGGYRDKTDYQDPNPTNFLSSPVRVNPGRMATHLYHMSKSTFEYCGISNSYR